jgi:hypothetical protein
MNEAGRSDTVMGLHLMENDTFKHWPTGLRGSGCSISSNAVETAKLHFRSPWYRRHNQRRQEHLASFPLGLSGKSVLEVGVAFLDLDCRVVSP